MWLQEETVTRTLVVVTRQAVAEGFPSNLGETGPQGESAQRGLVLGQSQITGRHGYRCWLGEACAT